MILYNKPLQQTEHNPKLSLDSKPMSQVVNNLFNIALCT